MQGKNEQNSNILITLFLVTGFLGGGFIGSYIMKKYYETHPKIIYQKSEPKIIYKYKYRVLHDSNQSSSTILSLNSNDIWDWMLSNYLYLSFAKKREIFDSLIHVSKKYKINPLILLAIIHRESSLRYWINHNQVAVYAPTDESRKHVKKIKTRAIGLGGVIWEIWKFDLIKNKIAQVKSDLYDPKINLEATAYIFKKLQEKPILKGCDTKEQSALIRYYGIMYTKQGTVNQTYFRKVDEFIGKFLRKKLYNGGSS